MTRVTCSRPERAAAARPWYQLAEFRPATDRAGGAVPSASVCLPARSALGCRHVHRPRRTARIGFLAAHLWTGVRSRHPPTCRLVCCTCRCEHVK